MTVPLVIAGAVGVLAACVHGGGGEALVVRKLSLETLPSTAFGGARMTKAMIHASWHMTTIAFLAAGISLLLAGTALDGEGARALAVLGAAAFTGFAALAVGLGAMNTRNPRLLLRHPGPAILSATAALAWWGALLI